MLYSLALINKEPIDIPIFMGEDDVDYLGRDDETSYKKI